MGCIAKPFCLLRNSLLEMASLHDGAPSGRAFAAQVPLSAGRG